MKRILCVLTAVCLSAGLLAGCGRQSGDGTRAMGRYIEEQVEVLSQTSRVQDFHLDEEGNLVFYAWNAAEGAPVIERCVLRSGGLERGSVDWLNALPQVSHISESGDGWVYALGRGEAGGNVLWRAREGGAPEQVHIPDWDNAADPGFSVSGGDMVGGSVSTSSSAAADGASVSTYGGEGDAFKPVSGLKALPGGDFLLLHADEGVSRYDTGGLLRAEFAGTTYMGGVSVFENTLLMGGSDGKSLWSYDLDTGKSAQSYTVDNLGLGAATGLDAEGAYVGDSSGICRQAPGGSVWEKLVDGDLTSLSMPTLSIAGLTGDGSGGFWAALSGEEDVQLVHYLYDPDTPSTPDTELTLFALQENNTVRQAIGEFQRRNPNMRVNYRVGLDADSAATADEVIRALNTELLAGKGPDLLLLDGLPVDSYIEKGVLTDLSGLVGGAGDLMPNLMDAYRRDDKIYGVPARFTVPVMMGAGDAVDAVSSLADLAEQVRARQGETPPFLAAPTSLWEDGGVIMRYYDACAGAFSGDGLDEAALTQYFTQMAALNAALRTHTPQAGGTTSAIIVTVSTGGNGFEVLDPGLMTLRQGQARFHIQDLAGRFTLENALSALRANEGYRLAPLFHGDSYTPVGGVGVVSSGTQQELARAFLETLLSPAVQDSYLYDGFPVNASSLEKMVKDSAGDSVGDDMGFLDLCRGLGTPILSDSVVKQAVESQAKDLADGVITPGQAAANVAGQVSIYLSE